MGRSSSAHELASKLHRTARAIPEAANRAVRAAGQSTAGVIRAGAPGRLSGVGRSGASLRVGVKVRRGDNPYAIVKAFGPWQLIESDTSPHTIVPRARRRRTGRAALRFQSAGGDVFAATVHHPGTRGQHPFEEGVNRAVPLVGQSFDKSVKLELLRRFG